MSIEPAFIRVPSRRREKAFWGMDLIVDGYNYVILTIVECSTNRLFMTKLSHGKITEPLAKEVRRLLLPNKKNINSRPGQKLKFKTPKAEFFKRIA